MSRSATENASSVTLHAEDLIDDRELADVGEDRLAHEGIVGQLASLVSSVSTPSNIALYGPWGSGKSGIANLLQSQIDRKNGIRFVRFDAFKYADVPLRRNFISAVAKGLGQNDSKYHADLYSGRTKTDIRVPPAAIVKLICVFALLMTALTLILGVVVAIVAWVQHGEYWVSFRALSKQVVTAGLLPASLLAALITLASKTFSVDRSLAKPESDEQFEQLFRDLVSDTRAKRLVVFVDELDRCSATEVVATLDTVRTFLGIDRCVFIIAADQNVLEEALTRAAKQSTPANAANPYYSTGSAYLDKVFQYQISLPPLLTQSVSKYANMLVSDRGGIWAEIKTEYVLSVLVPTHVSSPRRVKHLLNTFALTYRLVEERHRTGLLSEHPRDSAAAIARLVCLRVEFPLFARDLEVDSNLPSLVLQLMRDETEPFPASVSERAQQLARAYALAGAPPATVLTSRENTSASGDEEQTENTTSERDADAMTDAGSPTPTTKAHNKQLLNYLSRTRQVPGPSRNLIYMQSSGAVFGLDGELALALEQAAEDEDLETLKRRVTGLNETERDGVLELLNQQIRTGSGVAAPNTARSFLLLTSSMPDLHIDRVVDAVAEEICGLHDDATGVLDKDTVASAWTLANACSETGARALRARVVAATLTPGSKTPKDFLVNDALIALGAAPDEMSDYLASSLVSENGINTLDLLFAAPDDDVIQVLTTLRADVTRRATDALAAHKEWTEAQQQSSTVSPGTTSTASAPEEEPYDPTTLLLSLAEHAGTRETPVQHETIRLLLAIDARPARDSAEQLIRRSEPTTQPELAAALLTSGRRRHANLWPVWLQAVAPAAIQPAHAVLINRLLTSLWANESPDDETKAVLDALQPLIAALPPGAQPDLTSTITNELDTFVTSSDEASERRRLLTRADPFTAAGLVDGSLVAAAVVSTLQDTLAETLSPVGRDDPLYQYITNNGATAVAARAGSTNDTEIHGILSEAESSPWLDELGHVEVPLIIATHSGLAPAEMTALPTPQMMAEVIDNYADQSSRAASLWVSLTKPGPDDFVLVFDRLAAAHAVSTEFVEAAESTQKDWGSDQRRPVLNHYLNEPDTSAPDELTLRAIGLAAADDKMVADLLCDRFSRATNNTQRRAVVDLWTNAHINETAARKKLIETIVYGLLALSTSDNRNVSATELALTALDTLGDPLPYGIKGALGERIKTAVDGNKDLETKALRVLPRLGYSTTTGGFFGRSKRVQYTSN
ncbi:P-loop NTPase fold protein [Rhodococcus sp. IEGM 1251]|uniref:KAP family P-loop NTPase fold protein n=1 Tax=unclassified Rhodococcus (in: high G+C Gram-positive bacteria) TaxID=192944 RepID=UPI0024B82AF8|nr:MULTISPECIES: P-loop NTPase fold protein [unclassified Rhodococcus (in: high G+C Gram-positive bacteria)]MDI9966727.1 P-loop NTPase fold protein [Rhodococcus sp. IEGM 1251]MDV8129095.1 P-loop NTPase fold protein [Rhodococcus sp. IEGM 1304]